VRPLFILFIALGFLVVASAPARADDASRAHDELKQGYALKQAGNCEGAVPRFRLSFQLDAKPKALLNLADCEAQLGDLVAAHRDAAQGRDLAAQANDEELTSVAASQLSGIDKRLPHLTITLVRGTPSNCTVSRDGTPMTASARGVAVTLNPGPHVVAVTCTGRAERRFDLFISEGASAQIEAAPGAPVVAAVTPVAAPVDAAPPAPTSSEVSPSSTEGTPTYKVLAYAAFGVGAVGLTVGIASGVAATSKHGALTSECTGDSCPQSAAGDLNGFRSLRTWSTIGYVVGAVGAAGGAVLWFTAPGAPRDATSARVWVGPGAVGVGARF
jgi:hypothetical protein